MNKSDYSKNCRQAASPALILLRASCAGLSAIYLCGIILMLLPEGICDASHARDCAADLFAASMRLIALAAIFIPVCAALSNIYPSDSQ